MHINDEFSKAKVDFNFFDAITPVKNKQILHQYHLMQKKTDISDVEISCFLSHYLIWQKMVDEEIPCIGIFEDDIYLSDDANYFLKEYNWGALDFHVVKIERCYQKFARTGFFPTYRMKGRHLLRLQDDYYGAGGYILSNSGAKYLIDYYANLSAIIPVDKVIFGLMLQQHEYRAFQMNPAICIQDCVQTGDFDKFPSDLEDARVSYFLQKNEHSIVQDIKESKIKRELLRPFRQLKECVKYFFYKKIRFK